MAYIYSANIDYHEHSGVGMSDATLQELCASIVKHVTYYNDLYPGTVVVRAADLLCDQCNGSGRVTTVSPKRHHRTSKTCKTCRGSGIARSLLPELHMWWETDDPTDNLCMHCYNALFDPDACMDPNDLPTVTAFRCAIHGPRNCYGFEYACELCDKPVNYQGSN